MRLARHRAGWWGVAVPLGLLAVVVLLDAFEPPKVVVGVSFGVVAFVAAALTTPARTATVAALATGMVGLSGVWNHNLGAVNWWIRLVVTAVLGLLAVLLAAIRTNRERELRHMTLVAETAQRALLRVLPAHVGPVGLAARYQSATQEAMIGGDLYEVAETPYGVRVIVGDARGKGLEAVHMASTVLAAFRRSAYLRPALADVAHDLDAAVTSISDAEDFVTVVFAEFHDDSTATLVNCGHHPPLVFHDHVPSALADTGDPEPPLGLNPDPQPTTMAWPDGSRMLLYTDGLVEARDRRGVFFPLAKYVGELSRTDLDEALDALLARLASFAPRQDDDLAVVLVEHIRAPKKSPHYR